LKKLGALEGKDAQRLQNCVETRLNIKLFVHDSHEHIDRQSDPYLSLDGILGCAVKGLYSDIFSPQVNLFQKNHPRTVNEI